MLQLNKKIRRGYVSEDIIVERKLEGGRWHTTTESVPSRVSNKQISNTAIVIGNGINRLGFELLNFKKSSGLLGARTVQTYGCNALYRDFNPDFLVAVGNNGIVDEIAEYGYTNEHIVYSSAMHLLEFPGKFYLIPHDIYADAGTTAAYIAAFDEHKTIYLLGFDGQEPGNWNNNVYAGTAGYDATNFVVDHNEWILNRKQLFDVYDDVDWVWVTPKGTNIIPDLLKPCLNLRQISFRQLVLECDL
jgi:hypothetical protein